MKLLLGKALINKVANKLNSMVNIEDVLEIAKQAQVIEETVIEIAVNYYSKNKDKVEQQLLNISENDIQKAHDLLMKVLSYTSQWDKDLNLTIKFEEQTHE